MEAAPASGAMGIGTHAGVRRRHLEVDGHSLTPTHTPHTTTDNYSDNCHANGFRLTDKRRSFDRRSCDIGHIGQDFARFS